MSWLPRYGYLVGLLMACISFLKSNSKSTLERDASDKKILCKGIQPELSRGYLELRICVNTGVLSQGTGLNMSPLSVQTHIWCKVDQLTENHTGPNRLEQLTLDDWSSTPMFPKRESVVCNQGSAPLHKADAV